MTDETRLRIDRARRAEQALEEFVTPTFAAIKETYQARMSEIIAREPWELEKIKALVMAIRIVETVEGAAQTAVRDGEVAKHELTKVENITSMSHARRRALGL